MSHSYCVKRLGDGMHDAHRATHPGVKKYTLIGCKGIASMFDFEERRCTAIPDQQIGDALTHRGQRVDHRPCGSEGVHNLVMIRIDPSRSTHDARYHIGRRPF